MTDIALIGGGRWARVHASILADILEDGDGLLWVSRFDHSKVARFVREKQLKNVRIFQVIDEIWSHAPDGVIIASAPHSHAEYAVQAVERRIPALIEKPASIASEQTNKLLQLTRSLGSSVGVNLEFWYASYLHDFREKTTLADCHTIDVFWRDPVQEVRYGEEKRPDYFTRQVDDIFPHCQSLLRVMFGKTGFSPEIATADPDGEISLSGKTGTVATTIHISRFHTHRQRQISINGESCILDFSSEPGFSVFDGVRSENGWQGDRPMTRSLKDFVSLVKKRLQADSWPLALERWADSLEAADKARELVATAQLQCLRQLSSLADDRLIDKTANLLLDMYLPRLASLESRPDVSGTSRKHALVAEALAQYRNGNLDEHVRQTPSDDFDRRSGV